MAGGFVSVFFCFLGFLRHKMDAVRRTIERIARDLVGFKENGAKTKAVVVETSNSIQSRFEIYLEFGFWDLGFPSGGGRVVPVAAGLAVPVAVVVPLVPVMYSTTCASPISTLAFL